MKCRVCGSKKFARIAVYKVYADTEDGKSLPVEAIFVCTDCGTMTAMFEKPENAARADQ